MVVSWIKTTLALICLMLVVAAVNGQTIFNQGSANAIYRQLGGLASDKWQVIPNDTIRSTTMRKSGQIAFKYPYIYWLDSVTNTFVPIISDTGSSADTPTLTAVLTKNNRDSTNALWIGNYVFSQPQGRITNSFFSTNPTIPMNRTGYYSRVSVALTGTQPYTPQIAGNFISTIGADNTSNRTPNPALHPDWYSTTHLLDAQTGATGSIPFGVCAYANVSSVTGLTLDQVGGFLSESNHTGTRNNQFGFASFDIDAGTNGVGFYGGNGADWNGRFPTGYWGFYSKWSYPNYFRGNVQIGDTIPKGSYALQVTGQQISTDLDVYETDLSGSYTSRTKIDKGYADATYQGIGLSWALAGNSISSGQFIGTTNAQDLVFKANNTTQIRINYTLGRVEIGAGTPTTTATPMVINSGAVGTTQLTVENTAGGTSATMLQARESGTLSTNIVHNNSTRPYSATILAKPATSVIFSGSGDSSLILQNSATFGITKFAVGGGLESNVKMKLYPTGAMVVGANTNDDITGREVQVTGQIGISDSAILGFAKVGNLGSAITKAVGGVLVDANITDNGTVVTSTIPITVTKNQNTNTAITVSNTTNGTAAEAGISLTNNDGAATGQLFKLASGHSAYKTLSGSDLGFYNGTVLGNISILNDYASGNINFAAGGASSPHLTITPTGGLIIPAQTPPASASATGVAGTVIFGTDGYLYRCSATNTWIRVQLSTW